MAWRPALRLARREALRARGRSFLIVTLVALPVVGIGAADVLLRSAQLDPDERVARELGRTQARVAFFGGGPVIQAPDPHSEGAVSTGEPTVAPSLPELPAELRALPSREGTLTFRTAGGLAPLHVHEIDVGDPAFAGKFDLVSGRAPRKGGEVAVTEPARGRLGVEVGEPVELGDSKRTTRVVGVVEQVGGRGAETVWARPGTLLSQGEEESPPTVYLAGERELPWAEVLRLNRLGFIVYSRAVVLDPPPDSDVPYYGSAFDSAQNQQLVATAIGAVLVVTLALLEVVLLAGAAFAVGARRQERALGLVAAAGGAPAHVRRVVLAGGVVLGVVGALAGIALALGLAAVAVPLLERYGEQDFGRFDVRPLELTGIALVGFVAAVLAALLPARAAARRDPKETLTGRRGQVRTPRKVPAIGVALVGLGIAGAALGSLLALSSAAGVHPAGGRASLVPGGLIAAGAGLTQVGLIVCSPAIVGLAGHLSRRLPLSLRLALTDASRHRGRSAPAVAAVLAAVTGATALALVAASFDERDRRNYQPAWPSGTAGVQLEEFVTGPDGIAGMRLADPDRIVAAVRSELPPFDAHAIRSFPSCLDAKGCVSVSPILPPAQECPLYASGAPTPAAVSAAQSDPRCDPSRTYQGTFLPPIAVGDAELLRALAGRAPAEAQAVLAAGGVVALDPRYVVDGRLRTEVVPTEGTGSTFVELPAVGLSTPQPPVPALYSEGAAERLGLSVSPTHLLLVFGELPTQTQEDAARQAIEAAGFELTFSVERGYESDYGLGLLALVVGAAVITLGAAGIATGLAQADARADHATLAAVGATPRLRRTLAAAQAFAVAGLGALLGVFAGLVPAVAFVGALDSLSLALPWLTLLQVLLGIPLVAAAAAWLCTRSRLPLERRVAA